MLISLVVMCYSIKNAGRCCGDCKRTIICKPSSDDVPACKDFIDKNYSPQKTTYHKDTLPFWVIYNGMSKRERAAYKKNKK